MRQFWVAATAALFAVTMFWAPGVSGARAAAAAPAQPAARFGISAQAVSVGPKTVVMSTCSLPDPRFDQRVPLSVVSTLGPGDGLYGFAACRTAVPGSLYFFFSRAGHSMHELAPYRGAVEAISSDGTGAVYLCYSVRSAHDTWLYIARRSAQAEYSPPTLLTHNVGTFRPAVTLAAAPGTWWAVWSEATSTVQFPHHVLYERRTMVNVQPRHQITYPGPDNSDWQPALAVEGSLARLTWSRTGLDQFSGPGRMITRAQPGGTWAVGYFLRPLGTDASYPPSMVISEGHSYIVYPRFVYLDNGSGHFSLQPSVQPGGPVYLAVSAGVATIASPQNASHQPYVQFDELRSGTWSSALWPTFDSLDGVVSIDGTATLVMHKQNVPMLYLVSER